MYTIYLQSNGEILRSVSCPESLIAQQIGEGEAYIDGEYSWLSHRVEDGLAAPREHVINPSDFPHGTWDPVSGTWFDQRTLDECKAHALAEAKQARSAAISEGVVFSGHRYQIDQAARTTIAQYAQCLDDGSVVGIITADNYVVVLDVPALRLLLTSAMWRLAKVFADYQALRQKILAADSFDSIPQVAEL